MTGGFYGSPYGAALEHLRQVLAHYERSEGPGRVRSADDWLALEIVRPGTSMNGPSTAALLSGVHPDRAAAMRRDLIRAMVREHRLDRTETGYRLLGDRGSRR